MSTTPPRETERAEAHRRPSDQQSPVVEERPMVDGIPNEAGGTQSGANLTGGGTDTPDPPMIRATVNPSTVHGHSSDVSDPSVPAPSQRLAQGPPEALLALARDVYAAVYQSENPLPTSIFESDSPTAVSVRISAEEVRRRLAPTRSPTNQDRSGRMVDGI
ncbi:hypothetical protein FRB93_009673 [Tulasnella sp. JGI-2019a]|nr:hypothetical protein FRB93_009673 [Tulasnella sp. JGI-2019a]